MASVTASDVQKNFGEWHDKAYEGPVEITRYGRTTAYLVSAGLYREMMASYRKTLPVGDLDESTMELIRSAEVSTDAPYKLDDVADADERPTLDR